jgi:hypothetical protein
MKPDEMAQSIMEMYQSLIQSVNQAGGSGYSFDCHNLKNMTVSELIGKLATNGIRFTCIKKAPKEDPIDPEEDYVGVGMKK